MLTKRKNNENFHIVNSERTVMLRTFLLIFVAFPSLSQEVTKPGDVLFVGFDGVGYATISEMYQGGYFRNFQSPIPMVASFPSISDPNWARIMDVGVEPGYTK